MRQRECAGAQQPATGHVLLQRRLAPGAEHEPVHLIEDDLVVLEHRGPAETIDIEAPRPRQVISAKGDDRNLLLHGESLPTGSSQRKLSTDPRDGILATERFGDSSSLAKPSKSPGRDTAGGQSEKSQLDMNHKPGRDRPHVSRNLPHSSWNLDRPIMLT